MGLIWAVAGLARAEVETLWRWGTDRFARAEESWELAAFEEAEAIFQQVMTRAPEWAAGWKWLGVTRFHQVLVARSRTREPPLMPPVEETLDRAIAALEQALQRAPADAEVHAMLATLYGMKCEANWFRRLRYGPRVERHRQTALAVGDTNPRVQYLMGACLLHTARDTADWEKARDTLQRAVSLFASESDHPTGAREPGWGRAGALLLLAEAWEKLGDPEKAVRCYQEVLEFQPGNRCAQAGQLRLRGHTGSSS